MAPPATVVSVAISNDVRTIDPNPTTSLFEKMSSSGGMSSARYRRLSLVLEKMLAGFRQRAIDELDVNTLFEECSSPCDVDLGVVADDLSTSLRAHFMTVCESLRVDERLAELESSSRPVDICTDDEPDDVIAFNRIRLKLELKRQFESQLRETRDENAQLNVALRQTLDAL